MRIIATVLWLLPATVLGQVPDGYEVVRVTSFGRHSRPDLNNRSDLIWSFSSPPSVSNLFLMSGGIVRQITDEVYYDTTPRINDSGDYAYLVSSDFFGLVDVAWNIAGQLFVHDAQNAPGSWPDINNAGQVVWSDWARARDRGDMPVFLFDGVTSSQVTENGLSNQLPRINSTGHIVFGAVDVGQSGNPTDVILFDDGTLSTITTTIGQRTAQVIIDTGMIAWHESDLDGSNDRIVLWENGQQTIIVSGSVAGPNMNESGDVSYVVWNEKLSLWQQAIYLSSTQETVVLPHFGYSHAGSVAGMNECGEMSWLAGAPGPNIDWAVFMLRRIGPKGDFNHNCHIDAYDFAIVEHCFTGDGLGPVDGLLADCARADFDEDGDVDHADLLAFSTAVSGPVVESVNCQAKELCSAP